MKSENEDLELVSKSQLKREADALQKLGLALTLLKPAALTKIPISEELHQSIEEYNRLPNSFGAKRRQLQYIGRLMRHCDLDEIETAIADATNPSIPSEKSKRKKIREEKAQRLLAEGSSEIEHLLNQDSNLDRQQLRHLHREYQKAKPLKKEQLLKRVIEILRESSITID